MNDEMKESLAKDIESIKRIMEKFEKIKPSPIFWLLWGIITLMAGTLMQILHVTIVPQGAYFSYSIPWMVFAPIGVVITMIIERRLFKGVDKSSRDPTMKNKPSLSLLWLCIFSLTFVLMILSILTENFNFIWPIWNLTIGVGMIQTGNIFRSFYWSGKYWYFFGVISFVFGILFGFIIDLYIISPLILHLLMGFCWIAEGLRGRNENGRWTR